MQQANLTEQLDWIDHCIAVDLASLPASHPTSRAYRVGRFVMSRDTNIVPIYLRILNRVKTPLLLDDGITYEIVVTNDDAGDYDRILVSGDYSKVWDTYCRIFSAVLRDHLLALASEAE